MLHCIDGEYIRLNLCCVKWLWVQLNGCCTALMESVFSVEQLQHCIDMFSSTGLLRCVNGVCSVGLDVALRGWWCWRTTYWHLEELCESVAVTKACVREVDWCDYVSICNQQHTRCLIIENMELEARSQWGSPL